MAKIKVDNKYEFTCINNLWNLNLGIKNFLHVQMFVAPFCQGYEKQICS